MTKQEMIVAITALCNKAGSPCSIYEDGYMLDVALGYEWMDQATDTGTHYDKLIDDLNALGRGTEWAVCPCAKVYNGTLA